MSTILSALVSFISTDLAKTLIGLAINKLLQHQTDGITKDIALTMIDGIAKSQANPTTKEAFNDAIDLLKAYSE